MRDIWTWTLKSPDYVRIPSSYSRTQKCHKHRDHKTMEWLEWASFLSQFFMVLNVIFAWVTVNRHVTRWKVKEHGRHFWTFFFVFLLVSGISVISRTTEKMFAIRSLLALPFSSTGHWIAGAACAPTLVGGDSFSAINLTAQRWKRNQKWRKRKPIGAPRSRKMKYYVKQPTPIVPDELSELFWRNAHYKTECNALQ